MTTNITDKWESLCRLAESEMKRNHIPGVSLGLVLGDELYMAGFGVTNLNNPQPVEATTLFQIGSITKTFTGATTMRLVQEGNRREICKVGYSGIVSDCKVRVRVPR
jgi:CubicO group peptidase (beta-lactamase class C family)